MSDLQDCRVIVAGEGVFGLCVALAMAERGAKITLVSPVRGRASTVAAGMLAPASEAVLDPAAKDHYPLLAAARDAWRPMAERWPSLVEQSGCLFLGEAEGVEGRLRRLGARVERTSDGVFTPEDWRVDTERALAAFEDRCFGRLGARPRRGSVDRAEARKVILSDGEALEADAVVLATGYGGLALAPELAVITPVKGQLLRYEGRGPTGGPIRRGQGYLVPHRRGAIVGATMEPGRTDEQPDEAATARLRAWAGQLAGELDGAPAAAQAGIRPAAPDGLPMVGRSVTGVWIANGARRNGWLFAPMAGRLVAEGVAGAPVDPRLDPARFTAGGNPPAR